MVIFCSCLLITKHQPVQETLRFFSFSIAIFNRGIESPPKTTKFPDHSGVWCDWTSPIGLAAKWAYQNGLQRDTVFWSPTPSSFQWKHHHKSTVSSINLWKSGGGSPVDVHGEMLHLYAPRTYIYIYIFVHIFIISYNVHLIAFIYVYSYVYWEFIQVEGEVTRIQREGPLASWWS